MKNYSIALQAMVDMRMKFTDMYTGWPGSINDARILTKSTLYSLAEAGKRFTNEEMFVGSHKIQQYIVGDAGYSLLPKLMVPFSKRGLSTFKDDFNLKHSFSRIVVERAFGRLKGMWCHEPRMWSRTMFRPYPVDVGKLSVVYCCCVLNNIVILQSDVIAVNAVKLIKDHNPKYLTVPPSNTPSKARETLQDEVATILWQQGNNLDPSE